MTQFSPGMANPKAIERARRIEHLRQLIAKSPTGSDRDNLANALDLQGFASKSRFNEYLNVLIAVGSVVEIDGQLKAVPV